MDPLIRSVLNVIFGAVPERRSEFAELWAWYAPVIEVVPNQAGVTMNANRRRIQFDLKTLEAFWLIGFSAWHAIETYAPYVVAAVINQTSVESLIRDDDELGPLEQNYKNRLRLAKDLLAGGSLDAIQWPRDIPSPTDDRSSLRSDEERVAFDLTLMAVAYVFLHEFRHVMLDRDDEHPDCFAEEELSCDVWARGMFLDKLSSYAEERNHSYHEVLYKRAAAMAVACVILQTITDEWTQWGTAEYPSIGERMSALIGDIPLPAESRFWVVAASVLIGVMRETHLPIELVPRSAPDLVNELIERRR